MMRSLLSVHQCTAGRGDRGRLLPIPRGWSKNKTVGFFLGWEASTSRVLVNGSWRRPNVGALIDSDDVVPLAVYL